MHRREGRNGGGRARDSIARPHIRPRSGSHKGRQTMAFRAGYATRPASSRPHLDRTHLHASVVSSSDAIDGEFRNAERTTFAGSMTPAFTRSSSLSVSRVEAFFSYQGRTRGRRTSRDDRDYPVLEL